jgi:hypothetical protein
MGSVIDGTWKTMPPGFHGYGRIKLGTESNGGFKNVTITNCVFDHCYGIALETMDGALTEDIAISNITMRGLGFPPLFLRLGSRMRGPAGVPVGKLRRIVIQNIVSYGATPQPSIIAGVAGHPVEDVKISDVYFHSQGGGSAELAKRQPPEADKAYPDPDMFGDLPASGFFIRHARNIEMSNIEIVGRGAGRPSGLLAERDVQEATSSDCACPRAQASRSTRSRAFELRRPLASRSPDRRDDHPIVLALDQDACDASQTAGTDGSGGAGPGRAGARGAEVGGGRRLSQPDPARRLFRPGRHPGRRHAITWSRPASTSRRACRS